MFHDVRPKARLAGASLEPHPGKNVVSCHLQMLRSGTPSRGQSPTNWPMCSACFFLVRRFGGKLWRLKYRIDGREKSWALVPG